MFMDIVHCVEKLLDAEQELARCEKKLASVSKFTLTLHGQAGEGKEDGKGNLKQREQ
jgi:hypothetical protein